MAHQLALSFLALNFILDPGQRLLLLQGLAIQITHIMLGQMLLGGLITSNILAGRADGQHAGMLVQYRHEGQPFTREILGESGSES